jgi:hypothetical protein
MHSLIELMPIAVPARDLLGAIRWGWPCSFCCCADFSWQCGAAT